MAFVSFAQNLEDVVLWRAFKHFRSGFYIDVGAAWPTFHSVTKAFYERGWCGINIEPNPELLQELNKERVRDTNLGVAVGDTPGDVELNIMSNHGLTTVDDNIAESHEEIGFERTKLTVDLQTLAKICEDHLPDGQEIHFLKIDVEGLEEAVVRGNDWSKFRPWVVVIEATLPMSQVESHHGSETLLLDAGYSFVYADGLNRYYLAEEHAELKDAFKYPPNVFDEYVSSETQHIHETYAELQQMFTEADRGTGVLQESLESLLSDLVATENELAVVSDKLNTVQTLHAKRELIELPFFRLDGNPRYLVERALFHKNGKCRGSLKWIVCRRGGLPRRPFLLWLTSDRYQALAHAMRF